MSSEIIQSLWIGDHLPVMARLSAASFVAHGHAYHLYGYTRLTDLPPGVEFRDANAILPSSEIFTYSEGFGKGSYAAFSNLFRYVLLLERGGWWVDADVVCLQPFAFESESILATEWHDPAEQVGVITASSVIRQPEGSALMRDAVAAVLAKDRRTVRWGDIGPRLLDAIVARHGLTRTRVGPDIFSPVPHVAWRQVVDPACSPDFGPEVHGVHLWHQKWRAEGVNPDARFDPGCLYERLKSRFLTARTAVSL